MLEIIHINGDNIDAEIGACINDVWGEVNQALGKPPNSDEAIAAENRDFWRSQADPILLVARIEGQTVGFRFGHPFAPDPAAIFFDQNGGVRPGFRRQGVARQLIHRQHAIAADRGYGRMITDTALSLTPISKKGHTQIDQLLTTG